MPTGGHVCDEYVCVCGWVFNGTIQVFILFSYLELFKGTVVYLQEVNQLWLSVQCVQGESPTFSKLKIMSSSQTCWQWVCMSNYFLCTMYHLHCQSTCPEAPHICAVSPAQSTHCHQRQWHSKSRGWHTWKNTKRSWSEFIQLSLYVQFPHTLGWIGRHIYSK